MAYRFDIIYPKQDSSPLATKAYHLWKNIWQSTHQDIFSSKNIYSDPFRNADEVGILSHNNEPIGIHIYNYYDMNNEVTQDLKYFSPFPKETLEKVEVYQMSMALEWLCIAPEHRKKSTRILIGCSLSHFLGSNAGICLGVSSQQKKVQELAKSFGSETLCSDIKMGKDQVDIIYYNKDMVTLDNLTEFEKKVVQNIATKHRLKKVG